MRWTLLVAAAALAVPAATAAQANTTHISVMAGVAEYDLSGVETSPIYAIRYAGPLHPNLLVEGSLGYIRTDQQFGASDLFLPEVQVQLNGTWGRFSPYLGVGAGIAYDRPRGATGVDSDLDFAPAFSVGARVRVAQDVGIRVDGRLHGIEADFTGTVSALTGGIAFSW
jgi:hypothetical protein